MKNKERILLNFNEKAFNDVAKHQENAGASLPPLVDYCEETLQIKVKDLGAFFRDPRTYSINEYWEKYGSQFKDAAVKKEKVIALTGWEESTFENLYKNVRAAFGYLSGAQYELQENEVIFPNDPENFKVYLREEDQELYDLNMEFIKVAEKMEAIGGKPAWYLARFYNTLGVDGEKLILSKMFFQGDPKHRNNSIGYYIN